MTNIYFERISSKRTEALFIGLTVVFFLLFAWQARVAGLGSWSIVFFCLFAFFLFYVVNYRILNIQLTREALRLTFGIFTWTVPLANIEGCRLDDIPALMKFGGAGIHFMVIHKRYRASFNFLEYPRVVVTFKRRVGPVRDISFSTRKPDDVLQLIREAISAQNAA